MRCPKISEVVLFAGSHSRLVVRTPHVIVAAEVEQPVGQQMGKFGIQPVPDRLGLPNRRRERNRDVAQEIFIRHSLDEVISFIREREDVRWLVDTEELKVHPTNLIVIGDEDREGCAIFHGLARHHSLGQSVQSADIYSGRFDRDLD